MKGWCLGRSTEPLSLFSGSEERLQVLVLSAVCTIVLLYFFYCGDKVVHVHYAADHAADGPQYGSWVNDLVTVCFLLLLLYNILLLYFCSNKTD